MGVTSQLLEPGIPFSLPSEIFRDVNKGPFLNLNVVTDTPDDGTKSQILLSMRHAGAERARTAHLRSQLLNQSASKFGSFLQTRFAALTAAESKLSSWHPSESSDVVRSQLLAAVGDVVSARGTGFSQLGQVVNVAGCPQGWSNMGGGICLTGTAYNGNCGSSVNFSGMTPSEKMERAAECGAAFPTLP